MYSRNTLDIVVGTEGVGLYRVDAYSGYFTLNPPS